MKARSTDFPPELLHFCCRSFCELWRTESHCFHLIYSSLFRPGDLNLSLTDSSYQHASFPFPTLFAASRWMGKDHLGRHKTWGRTSCSVRTLWDQSPCWGNLRRKQITNSSTQHCSQASKVPSHWLMSIPNRTPSLQLEVSATRLMVTCGSRRCLELLQLIYLRVRSCCSLTLKRALQPWSQYSPDLTHESWSWITINTLNNKTHFNI